MASAVGLAVGLVVASWPAPANGAPFDLVWSAPAGCPSREVIVAATQASLGESPSEASPELFVQGAVRAVGGGFVVKLGLKDASGRALGEREVRVGPPSCEAIEEPVSLVLAMMIAVARPRLEERGDSAERAETPPPSTPAPASVRGPSSTPAPPPSTPAPAARPSAEPLPHRLVVGAAGVGSLGVLPNVGRGFAIRAMYSPRSIVLVGLEASFEACGSVRVESGEVGFQLFAASARVGVAALRTARFELIPTAGVRAGASRSIPTGFSVVKDETRASLLAGTGALARVELAPHIFAEILPELEVALIRDRLQIRHGAKLYSVHRASLFGARVSLGLGYEFH